jgi:hypothetical protein
VNAGSSDLCVKCDVFHTHFEFSCKVHLFHTRNSPTCIFTPQMFHMLDIRFHTANAHMHGVLRLEVSHGKRFTQTEFSDMYCTVFDFHAPFFSRENTDFDLCV